MNQKVVAPGHVAQLCFTYDQAQAASRDPKRRRNVNHYLDIMSDKRTAIIAKVGGLMKRLPEENTPSLVELVYFNTWLTLRGGWTG
jgi:hypothetical protein